MQPLVKKVWHDKYRYGEEQSREESLIRVVNAIYSKDPDQKERQRALAATTALYWCPAGREHAGAGTNKRVTLINCFVSPEIEDSLDSHKGVGILDAIKVAALTQQMGGGIGMDFSTIRPHGAVVKRTGSVSTGPLPFMDSWDSMCETIESSGSRRGAMMATMRCDHPDVWDPQGKEIAPDGKLIRPTFITAKREPGRLTNFNVSVLVTDKFMQAVENDEEWELGFNVPRADDQHIRIKNTENGPWYVYKVAPARQIWNDIIQNTYDYAEPGVIFIDRVNKLNNLNYCETISCTNPCGEQPLPPNGDCNLGAVNLARLVNHPFTSKAKIDYDKLRETIAVGVRFLDNVLDVTLFPTKEQEAEAHAKRRIGLGITGLGNMLQMLRIRYGSDDAVELTRKIMWTIADTAYFTSAMLAEERGTFPLYSKEDFAKSPILNELSEATRSAVEEFGIRNGVLLTVAPTGTTSIYYDNISSGLEPTYFWSYWRDYIYQGKKEEFEVVDYAYNIFREMFGEEACKELPDYMVSAQDLTVAEHLRMQAAVQKYIDASVSKTINCPEDMAFEDFKDVYTRAYDIGLKGCTTYRPNPDSGRGSVLRLNSSSVPQNGILDKLPRDEVVMGRTYKIKWPPVKTAYYVTINDIEIDGQKRPFEIFINSKSATHEEWIKSLTRLISAVFRKGGDVSFLVEELEQIHAAQGGAFVDQKYVPSLPALFGQVLKRHFIDLGIIESEKSSEKVSGIKGNLCPVCNQFALVHQEGCDMCTACGHSTCG